MDLQTHPFPAGRDRSAVPRRLVWAMAVSLLAHVLLLWPSSVRTVRPLLHASLRPGPVSLPAPAAVMPAGAPPAQAPSRAVPAVPPVAARKTPVRPKSVPDAAASPASRTALSAVAADPVELAPLVDAESLRSYRLALALNARRFHQYPPTAIEQGHAGTAQVRIAVANNGLPGRVDLIRSSGHDALDREAREMLARAAQATVLPDALRGHAFAVDLPVEFSLPAR